MRDNRAFSRFIKDVKKSIRRNIKNMRRGFLADYVRMFAGVLRRVFRRRTAWRRIPFVWRSAIGQYGGKRYV